MDLQTAPTTWQAGWAGKSMGRLGRPRMPMSGTRPFCETNSLQWSCGVVGEDRVNELHGVEHVVDQGNRLLLRTGGRAPEVAQWLVLLHCPPPLPPPLPPHHCSPPNPGSRPSAQTSSRRWMMAAVADCLRLGWCLINSSMALPRLVAVFPRGSADLLRLMAGK